MDIEEFAWIVTSAQTCSCVMHCDICGKTTYGCSEISEEEGCGKCNGGSPYADSIPYIYWNGRSIGPCCIEKHFTPFKSMFDRYRVGIIKYYKKQAEEKLAEATEYSKQIGTL